MRTNLKSRWCCARWYYLTKSKMYTLDSCNMQTCANQKSVPTILCTVVWETTRVLRLYRTISVEQRKSNGPRNTRIAHAKKNAKHEALHAGERELSKIKRESSQANIVVKRTPSQPIGEELPNNNTYSSTQDMPGGTVVLKWSIVPDYFLFFKVFRFSNFKNKCSTSK